MAVTGVSNYNNVYENVYATKKEETKETSASQKKEDAAKKNSYLSQLQDKYSNFDITAGTFSKGQISSKNKGFQGVMVSSAYLSKAENDGETAKKLDEMLSGVESAQKWLKNACERDGLELVSCGYFIDENGNMGSYSVVEKKHSMFDGLAEQSKKNADRIKEKQEKAKEQKKADEKKAEEKKEKQEQQVKASKDKIVVVASSDKEMVKKAKDELLGKNEQVKAKEEKAVGNNFDYSI